MMPLQQRKEKVKGAATAESKKRVKNAAVAEGRTGRTEVVKDAPTAADREGKRCGYKKRGSRSPLAEAEAR